MFKKFVTFVSLFVLLLATVSSVGAITWGQPDGNGHPNVVAILFEQDGGLYSCSGTLLTPYVVLTAGHCTEGAGEANTRTWVRNDPDIDAVIASEYLSGAYGGLFNWLNTTWATGEAIPHPQYDDYSAFPNTYDIGVVLLDEPIYVSEYGELPTLGQFEYLRTARGSTRQRSVVDVGYGLQGRIPAFADDQWERYVGYATIIGMGTSQASGYQNFVMTNSPGLGHGSGGTCSGDSGGPAFWVDPATGQETNIVVGVNSYSITPQCNGNDYMFRTDIADALDFVTPYLGHGA